MNDIEAIDRGSRAEKILNDPLYQEAYDRVRLHLLETFEHSPLRDEAGREHIRRLLHCLELVRRAMGEAMNDGKIAASTLELKRQGTGFLGEIWQSRRKR